MLPQRRGARSQLPGLERGAGGARLVAWFGAGTLAGGAVSLFEPAATLLGSGPALLGVAVGLAWRGPDQATRSPLCATGRWLGTGLAVAAFLPGVTPSPGGTIRMALAP